MIDNPYVELVRPYVGQKIEDVGTLLPEISSYNHNYYMLPNKTTVLVESDDDGFAYVSVIDDSSLEHLVGYEEWGYGFEIGNI